MSDLTQALEEHVSVDQTITVRFENGKFVTEMGGFWNGSLLKSAIRSIEREYTNVRKVSIVDAMKKSQVVKTGE